MCVYVFGRLIMMVPSRQPARQPSSSPSSATGEHRYDASDGAWPPIESLMMMMFINTAPNDDIALHPLLLDDSDVYLVALLAPLADSADELSDDEIQKLPLRLQYYEGTRDSSVEVRQKSVEALYQLCATRHAREHLRRRGVYALLRELDRASDEGDEDKKKPQSGWIGGVKLLAAQQEHTLHALIGILIRLEDEMEVDPNVASLRALE
ncbi:unnamed protein product [Nippostrongylus brasiliensis]|uniref:DUF384 domain-containing protein n=1 Tax=Nippostrongylus brasiliensis TaxID=27835 RepID=A0A0N4YJ43_NIPBR|nr:unnamed protein product [Nippostrongylus brasiliensis]